MMIPGRVLHLGKAYPPWIGGVERSMEDLAIELARRGWHVDVLAAAHNHVHSEEIRQGVSVHRIACRGRIWSLPIAPGYLRACRRLAQNADIIHIHVPNPVAQLATLHWTYDRPVVVTWHSDVVRQRGVALPLKALERLSLSRSKTIFATSPNYWKSSPMLQEHTDRVRVLPLGLDLERFDLKMARAENMAARLSSKYPRPVTLCVGRLVAYKGLQYLIKAMPGFSGSVVIAGDGPLRNRLCTLAEQLGVRDRLFIESGLSDSELQAYYSIADVFVLPSILRSEAFGLVQLEAFAAGIPVVSTDIPTGVPWVNQDGQTGFIVPPKSSEGLTQALRILLNNQELRKSMGVMARSRVKRVFNLKNVVSALEAVYTEVMADNSRSEERPREYASHESG